MQPKMMSDTLVPSALLPELRAAAEEDHQVPGKLVREALECYLKDRRWRRLVELGHARSQELGVSENDLPRLIAESREERREGH